MHFTCCIGTGTSSILLNSKGITRQLEIVKINKTALSWSKKSCRKTSMHFFSKFSIVQFIYYIEISKGILIFVSQKLRNKNKLWEPAKFWKTIALFYHHHVINVMWKLTLNFCTICVQIQIFFDEKSLCYFQRWGSWFSTKPSFYGLKEKLALKLDMTKNQTPIFIHSAMYEL